MKIYESLKAYKKTEQSKELSGSVERAGGDAFRQSLQKALQGFSPMTVQKGDTLVGMTRKHLGTQVWHFNNHQIYEIAKSIAQSNGLTSADRIRQGQNLNMPGVETLLAGSRAKPETLLTSFSSITKPPVIGLNDDSAHNMENSFDNLTSRQSSPHTWPNDAPLGSTPPFLTSRNKALSGALQVSPPLGQGRAHPRLVIVGDSIAVGIGGSILKRSGVTLQFAQGEKFPMQDEHGLSVEATGGHSTPQILKRIQNNESVKNADTAVISAATNDWVNMSVNPYYTPSRILQNLNVIRRELNAKNYIWVLPYEAEPKALVKSLAEKYGDQTIDLADFRKADKYHPREYGAVAATVNQLLEFSEKNSYANESLRMDITSTSQAMNLASTLPSTNQILQYKGTEDKRQRLN